MGLGKKTAIGCERKDGVYAHWKEERNKCLDVWDLNEFYIHKRHAGFEMGIGKDIIWP
jgi:hypothetical protein